MGADNWTECPKCKALADEARETAITKANKAYGKVSLDEWKALQDAAEEMPELAETLREDYEIRTDNEGTFKVSYACRCTKCSFAFTFNQNQDVLIPA